MTLFWMCIGISSKVWFNVQGWGRFSPHKPLSAGSVQALLPQNLDECVISSSQKIIEMMKWMLSFTNIGNWD